MDTVARKREQMREIRNRFIALHKEQGLCTECSNPVEAGNLRCTACLTRRAKKQKERKSLALSEGKCRICLKVPALPTSRYCVDCYLRRVSFAHFKTETHWKRLKAQYEAQQGKCALSGVELTLGDNAELDHIKPSSRGGSDELDNVQWVLCVVNRMKDHLLESEFFGLIEKLYHTMKERSVSSP